MLAENDGVGGEEPRRRRSPRWRTTMDAFSIKICIFLLLCLLHRVLGFERFHYTRVKIGSLTNLWFQQEAQELLPNLSRSTFICRRSKHERHNILLLDELINNMAKIYMINLKRQAYLSKATGQRTQNKSRCEYRLSIEATIWSYKRQGSKFYSFSS